MIYIDNISKKYSSGNGIFDINLEIDDGKVVSFIGPNGAGKSTLLNVLAGKLKQDSGEIYYNEEKLENNDRRQLFGYMPDNYNVSEKITSIELLRLVSDFRFNGEGKNFINASIDKIGVSQWTNTKVSELSLGNKKKLALIIAFMQFPKLIILDEPTNGIDVPGVLYMKELIETAKDKGSIVVISSHILDFLGSICDVHYFMKDGHIVCDVRDENLLEKKYKELYF